MHLPPPEPRDSELYTRMDPVYAPAHFEPFTDMIGPDPQQFTELAASHDQLESSHVFSPDTRRLQTQHTTEGYRDGITVGKAESIQAGFDEGFNLGAEIGLKVGQLLGILEGMAAALRENSIENSPDISVHMDKLLSDASKELCTEVIFAQEYWTPDGNWKYSVGGDGDDGDISTQDIAREHPVVLKWDELISREAQKWKLN
ncbi:uncharacterized protein F4812DRAFT_6227 [Daldinia caldariorum]|uniref:uncharacterized protein n=1 Tax=Daldinia caldariorum TaxID=326644 RepID=UPI0020087F85|nr:uncharacterized protein F4812DRAFT_6227 [Daldinia caldariorum]KAI1472263.1 hypothetical protein F4812DRAFT_6227 [Daldinia caldariorum]